MVLNQRIREAFKKAYMTRGRYRTTRRSITETLKLAQLAKQLIDAYIVVIEWCGEKRVLKLIK
jgi:UV DNA damage repair endonuclease